MRSETNTIHPTAIVHPSVLMGEYNYIGPYCVFGPNVVIGSHNKFESCCSVGSTAEHRKFWDSAAGRVMIGSYNTIREFTTINGGTERTTTMGSRCAMLRGSHLSHDSHMEDDVTLSCNVLLGGHSYVMKNANIGLGAVIHQNQVIGSYSMIGMGAVVTKKLEVAPAGVYAGNPAKLIKQNMVGIQRAQLKEYELVLEMERFTALRSY